MDKNKIAFLTQSFNAIAHQEEQVEYWLARELQRQLGYKTWENFETAIFRAMESVSATGVDVSDHFVRSRKWSVWEVEHCGQLKIIC